MADAWIMCLVIVILGGVAGYGLSTRHQTLTTAEARLAVGSQSLAAYQVAGFAEASEELAANYARFVNASSTTQHALVGALGARTSQITAVSSSPIPDSDVVSVEVQATNPETAVLGARVIAQRLAQQSSHQNAATSITTLLHKYDAISLAVVKQTTLSDKAASRASKGSATKATQAAADTAAGKLASLTEQQTAAGAAYQTASVSPDAQSGLQIIQGAAVLGNNQRRTQELYLLSGLLLGMVVALVAASLRSRRRGRKTLPPQPLVLPEIEPVSEVQISLPAATPSVSVVPQIAVQRRTRAPRPPAATTTTGTTKRAPRKTTAQRP